MTAPLTGETGLAELIEGWLSSEPGAHGTRRRFPQALERRFTADRRRENGARTVIWGALALLAGVGILALGRAQPPCLLVADIAALMVYVVAGLHLRLSQAAGALAAILIFCWTILRARPDIDAETSLSLTLTLAAIAGCLGVAGWRLDLALRRAYALALLVRLQGEEIGGQTVGLGELAARDTLTGLANRRALDAWLAALWAQAGTVRGRVGLILLDIDQFQAVNEFAGPLAGDECLRRIGLCLRDRLRGTTDLVARLRGGEFAVLLPALGEDLCADIAERMRRAVQALELPNPGLGARGLLTISAGVASQSVSPDLQPASLVDAAAAALLQAKLSGRNQVCVATLATPTSRSQEVAE